MNHLLACCQAYAEKKFCRGFVFFHLELAEGFRVTSRFVNPLSPI
jgi:hypothetical protein